MDGTRSHPNSAIIQQYPRTVKRKIDGVDVDHNIGKINELPEEILVAILSCMSLEDAGRTSVLSRRWRYLWAFKFGRSNFEFSTETIKTENFKTLVNQVLKLRHDIPLVDKFEVRFVNPSIPSDCGEIDSWVYFAMRKQVKEFQLLLAGSVRGGPCYEFPNMDKLLSVGCSCFHSLRSLKLWGFSVDAHVLEYFLASCPFLELLYLFNCHSTKSLRVVDPIRNLKSLEIYYCNNIQRLEIFAVNLVSFVYRGDNISWQFKNFPNLSDLTLGGKFCDSFIYEPNRHSSYSVQLVKLTLSIPITYDGQKVAPRDLPQLSSLKQLFVSTRSKVGQSLLFFTSLIKASPLLHEFTIEIDYKLYSDCYEEILMQWFTFPEVKARTRAGSFIHRNLKVVQMNGFIGSSCESKFLLEVSKIAPSLEKVIINTSRYFDQDPSKVTGVKTMEELKKIGTRDEARKRAKSFIKSRFRPDILGVID